MNKRPYKDGVYDDVVYYIGKNVEKTLAFGKQTLFLNQFRPSHLVIDIANDRKCEHIYIGAGGSFSPAQPWEWKEYDVLVEELTAAGFLVTVEHNLTQSEWFLESGFVENSMVIPVLSIEIPYIAQYGHNSCLKITDKSFGATNPGVWVHSYNEITKDDAFTHWNEYKDDLPI